MLLLVFQMSYHIVHSRRTIAHPKANKRNAPGTILKPFEEKHGTLTIVAATIRAGEAELKLKPCCPAGSGARTQREAVISTRRMDLSLKRDFSGAMPQRPLIQDV